MDYPVSGTINDLVEASDGGYVCTVYDWGISDSICIIKSDEFGNLEWIKKYKNDAAAWEVKSIQSSGEDFFIAGNNGNVCLMKTDNEFNFLWETEFGGSEENHCNQMVATSDGGCIMVGYAESAGSNGNDIYVIKTDENGQIVGTGEQPLTDPGLNICPNPVLGSATITFPGQINKATLEIYNLQGRMMNKVENVSGKSLELNFEYLPAGVYFISLTEQKKMIGSGRMVVFKK